MIYVLKILVDYVLNKDIILRCVSNSKKWDNALRELINLYEVVKMVKDVVTFTCPRCSRVASVNIPGNFCQKNSMEIECRCECGYQFKRTVERRRHIRKAVKFSGWYKYTNEIQLEPGVVAGKFVGKGKMTVVNLSVGGLKIKLKKKEELKIHDRLQVEFYLKDYQRTLIRETATIKNIHQKFVGGAFFPTGSKSRELGFNLLG